MFLLGIVGVTLAAMLISLGSVFHSLANEREQAAASARLADSIAQLRFVLVETMLFRESRPREQWANKISSMRNELEIVQYDDPRRSAMVRRIKGSLVALDALYTRLLRFGPVFESDANMMRTPTGIATTVSALLVVTQEMLDDSIDLAARAKHDAEQKENLAMVVSIAWIAIVAITSVGMFRLVRKRMLVPIMTLQNGAERIKAGDYDIRLGMEGSDEMGELGRSFDDMARQVQKHQFALKREVAVSRYAQMKVQAIFDQAPYAILTLDSSGSVDNANRAAEQLFGYSLSDMRAMPMTDLIEPWHSETPAQDSEERVFAKSKGDGRFEIELVRGQIATETSHMTIVMVQNISDRIRAQEKLEQFNRELTRSNKELADFAYVASHDLKSPLHGIDQLATWICEDASDVLPKDSLDHLQMMRVRIRRMEALLNDLLAYSRAGHLSAEFSAVDTGQLVSETFDLFGAEHFSLEFESLMPTLTTLRAPLQMIFRNLMGNAIKHHDQERGHIWVKAEQVSRGWMFTVRDDGPGIEPKYHAKVFEMFQTLKPRDEVEGSGMGLAVVKKALDRVGSSITLESSGRGSTFRFLWPAEREIRRVLNA